MNADHLNRVLHTETAEWSHDPQLKHSKTCSFGAAADDSNVRSRFADHSWTRKSAARLVTENRCDSWGEVAGAKGSAKLWLEPSSFFEMVSRILLPYRRVTGYQATS
jgi:hypothetical protein